MDGSNAPVRAKAILIEPGSFTVTWMNESASRDCADIDSCIGAPVDKAVPLAGVLGVMEALKTVKDAGVSQHLRTGVIKTGKGSMELAASIYRLPSGDLLLLMEDTWQVKKRTGEGTGPRRGSGRRKR